MLVRPRTEDDLDACERIARVVRERDGYPPHLPSELRRFIDSPDAIAAWVADSDDGILGHVALHHTSSAVVMALAMEATGLPAEQLAVVARLFVSPQARRQGVGRSLLRTATTEALSRLLRPILDVGSHFDAAMSLYERAGWTCAGTVTVSFGYAALRELVFLGPMPSWP